MQVDSAMMIDGRQERPSVSVVVPVFDGELTLTELARRLGAVLPRATRTYEAILVNDGSRDASWAIIGQLAAEHAWIRGIDLLRNYGQHNALLAGIRAARHDVIVTLDDDLQNPPEEISRLLDTLAEGVDVVYGRPAMERHGLFRDLASVVTKIALQQAMGANIARQVSAFRAFRAPIRDAFADYQSPYVSIDVLLTWGTTRFTAVPVRHDPRRLGTSGYTFRKLLLHSLNMMTGFSTVPLQLASLIGFGFLIVGIGILAVVVVNYLVVGSAVPGFAFLASIIAIFSGAQLFALGVIGEYLARMHFRLMDRPAYTLRRTTAER